MTSVCLLAHERKNVFYVQISNRWLKKNRSGLSLSVTCLPSLTSLSFPLHPSPSTSPLPFLPPLPSPTTPSSLPVPFPVNFPLFPHRHPSPTPHTLNSPPPHHSTPHCPPFPPSPHFLFSFPSPPLPSPLSPLLSPYFLLCFCCSFILNSELGV